MKKRLMKSKSNVVFSGVLGGIGEYLGIDPTILRVIFILIVFLGAGSPIPLYFILMFVLPSDKRDRRNGSYNTYENPRDSYQSYHNYGQPTKGPKKRKEAEKVEDEDWSDF
ncbi:PspC domain-containing protein [Vagococcus salmoninarum]|uniref:PspC domain-containing protein n=2 Tax=Vagococcus salmoninarum TaxID=2739 RepID=UPI00187EF8E4|nr:PspC domain-containing protein [Vagococcus salmoninarum]MBE9388008.1 PspC domain-containing protein [Vagococcus salmoninarum]